MEVLEQPTSPALNLDLGAKLEHYRTVIEQVLLPYTEIPYSHGEMVCKPVFDRHNDRYILVTVGWDWPRRVHGCLVHLDMIAGKIWVQRDETEDGVSPDLVRAGVDRRDIILAFHPPDVWADTDYGVP